MYMFGIILVFLSVPTSKGSAKKEIYGIETLAILTDETRLHNDIFHTKQYSHPTNKMLNVTFRLSSVSVFYYDAPGETIIVNAYLRQFWSNPAMRWNPEDYGGIKKVNVWSETTWVPDVFAYGNVETQFKYNGQINTLNTRIVVTRDGLHAWYAPIVMKLGCRMNVKDFPFDTQRCNLVFGSFTQDKSKLNLVPDGVSIKQYTGSTEWLIESMNNTIEDILHPGSTIEFSRISYTLVLKRRSLFFLLKLFGPVTTLAFLALLGFVQPLAGHDRVVYNLSIVLLYVWLIAAGFDGTYAFLPRSSDGLPVSNIFLGLSFIVIVMICAILCYTILVYYSNIGVSEMPTFIRKQLLERLGAYVGCNVTHEWPLWRRNLSVIKEAEGYTTSGGLPSSFEYTDGDEEIFQQFFAQNESMYSTKEKRKGKLENALGADIDELHVRLDLYLDKLEEDDDKRCKAREWHTLALVLDYIFVRVFTLVLGFTSMYCIILMVNLYYGT